MKQNNDLCGHDFENKLLLVCSAYKQLLKIKPDNGLLSLVKLEERGFAETNEYREKYVRPYLKSSDGQLCLWDWAYPNESEARLKGMTDYMNDLYEAIKQKTLPLF